MKVDARMLPGLVAFFAPVVLLLPFIGKPFHIDDPLFVWMARQITQDPSDPFSINVFWGDTTEPMFLANQNPPGISYWLALTGIVAGWSEPAMHLSMSIFAGLAGLGIYFLARELCHRPLLAS